MSINCGNCKTSHESVDEVRACFNGGTDTLVRTDEKVVLSDQPISFKGFPPFQAGEKVLTITELKVARNTNTQSLRMEFVLSGIGNRPVYTNISVAGRNRKLVNRLYCLFAGAELTDVLAEDELTEERIVMAFDNVVVGQKVRCWVREMEPNSLGHVFLTSSPTTWHKA